MADLDGHPDKRRAWRLSLTVAAKLALGVALVVALVAAQGCTKATSSENDPPATPTGPTPGPTTPPPAPAPAPAPAQFFGTYGPGTFTRTFMGCPEHLFNPSYTASVVVPSDQTSASISDVQRNSTCVFTRGFARCTGSGPITDGVSATWSLDLTFDGTGQRLVAAESLLTSGRFNCVVSYVSGSLTRQ